MLKQGLNHAKSRNREHGRGMCLSRGQIMSSRASGKQRWVRKQGLKIMLIRASGGMERVGA